MGLSGILRLGRYSVPLTLLSQKLLSFSYDSDDLLPIITLCFGKNLYKVVHHIVKKTHLALSNRAQVKFGQCHVNCVDSIFVFIIYFFFRGFLFRLTIYEI